MSTKFNVGEVMVYPAHGLSEVQAVETRQIGGSTVEFYVLKILKKNISVMVPVANGDRIGLRPVVGADEIQRVAETLHQRSRSHYTQWHHRYSDNFDKLKTGSMLLTAEVYRDLAALKRRKNLAIKESRMMDSARSMIVSEIAHVLALSEEKVDHWVDALLKGEAAPQPPAEDGDGDLLLSQTA